MDAIWFQQALERAASRRPIWPASALAPSAVSAMLKGERQMKLLERLQVSAFFGVTQDEVLRHAGGNIDAPTRTAPRAGTPRSSAPSWTDPRSAVGAEPIPIRSAAAAAGPADVPVRRPDRHTRPGQSETACAGLCDLYGGRQHGAALTSRAGCCTSTPFKRRPVAATS